MAEKPHRGERLLLIYLYLLRHRSKKTRSTDLLEMLISAGDVSEELRNPSGDADTTARKACLRNIQRDLQSMVALKDSCIESRRDNVGSYYQIDRVAHSNLVLPLPRNQLFAFFMMKRLCSMESSNAVKALEEHLLDRGGSAAADLFIDLDEYLVLQGASGMVPPSDDVLSLVAEALVKRSEMEVMYRYHPGDAPEKKTVLPVHLVLSNGELFVQCVSRRHPKRAFPLKLVRIESLTVLQTRLELSDYARAVIRADSEQKFGIRDNDEKQMEVSVLFPDSYERNLVEAPLHRTQKLTAADYGCVRLTMTVAVGQELVTWFMGVCDIATIEGPVKFKTMVRKHLKEALADLA